MKQEKPIELFGKEDYSINNQTFQIRAYINPTMGVCSIEVYQGGKKLTDPKYNRQIQLLMKTEKCLSSATPEEENIIENEFKDLEMLLHSPQETILPVETPETEKQDED